MFVCGGTKGLDISMDRSMHEAEKNITQVLNLSTFKVKFQKKNGKIRKMFVI